MVNLSLSVRGKRSSLQIALNAAAACDDRYQGWARWHIMGRKVRGSMALLEAKQVTKRFGSLVAVNRVDVRIEPGTIHAIIGPNGAGKTTLFNCVTGVYGQDEGTIVFKGQPLDGVKPHQRAILGISRTFQNIRLFPQMTVLENVMVGRHCRTHAGLLRMFFPARTLQEERAIRERAEETPGVYRSQPSA